FEESGTRRRYFLAHPNGEEAELVFTRPSSDFVIIEHTAVPDVFRGKGVGTRLVERAVEDARKGGWKILPLCPFAAAQFRRHKEWADVLRNGGGRTTEELKEAGACVLGEGATGNG